MRVFMSFTFLFFIFSICSPLSKAAAPNTPTPPVIVVRIFSASWCPACIKFWDQVKAKDFVPQMPINIGGTDYKVELKKIDVSDGIESVKNIMTSVSIPETQILFNNIRIAVWVGEFPSAEAFRGYVEENVKKVLKSKTQLMGAPEPSAEIPVLLQKKKPSDSRRFLFLTSASDAKENLCSYGEDFLDLLNLATSNHKVLEDSVFTISGTSDFENAGEQCLNDKNKISYVDGLVSDFPFQMGSLLDLRTPLTEKADTLVIVANGKINSKDKKSGFKFWADSENTNRTNFSFEDFSKYISSLNVPKTVYFGNHELNSDLLLGQIDCLFNGNADIDNKPYLSYMLTETAKPETTLIGAQMNALKLLTPQSLLNQNLILPQTGIDILARENASHFLIPQNAAQLEHLLKHFKDTIEVKTFNEFQKTVENTLGYPITYFNPKAETLPFTLKAKNRDGNDVDLFGKFFTDPKNPAHTIDFKLEEQSIPLLTQITRKPHINTPFESMNLINLDGKFTFSLKYKNFIEILSPAYLAFDLPEQVGLLFAIEENLNVKLLYLKMTNLLKRIAFLGYAEKNPVLQQRVSRLSACESTSILLE